MQVVKSDKMLVKAYKKGVTGLEPFARDAGLPEWPESGRKRRVADHLGFEARSEEV